MKKELQSIKLPRSDVPVDILWIAGEHSGDQHAARIAADIRDENPGVTQVAIGGPALAAAGFPLLHDLTESSVVGLVEVLKNYRYFKKVFNGILEWVTVHEPKVIVLVDYPGFNLRLADALYQLRLSRKAGGPIALYYYISPQVWAWKGHRRFQMAKRVDELGVIFPFEVEVFKDTELETHFVGHPFLDKRYVSRLEYDGEGAILLLSGSRMQAVKRIFPMIVEGVLAYQKKYDKGHENDFATIVPNEKIKEEVTAIAERMKFPIKIYTSEERVRAKAVITSSGTMSLDCALAGIPGILVYRAHPLTYWMGKCLVKIPYLGIANLILDKAMYPEFIQGEAKAGRLADELNGCLSEKSLATTREDLGRLKTILSPSYENTASKRIIQQIGH